MKKVLILGAILWVACVLTACGIDARSKPSSASVNENSTSVNPIIPFKLPSGDGLHGHTQDVLQNYSNYDKPVNKSMYEHFGAVDKPWKVYFNTSFRETAWMSAVEESLQQNIAKYKAAGLVSEYVVTNSNGDINRQIQQMQTAIEQGADLIITIAGSPDEMNGVIKQAYDSGIVVIALGSNVTSPYSIKVNINSFIQEAVMATGIVRALDGKGNVLMVDGIAGTPSNYEIHKGAMAVFNQNPEINVVGTINGDWRPTIAKEVVLQFLEKYPKKIDAVWQQGSMFWGAVQAIEQAGRPIVPVTFADPLESELAYAYENLNTAGWQTIGTANPAGSLADAAFRIGVFTLLGYGPKVDTFLQAPPEITREDLKDWHKPSFTQESHVIVEPPAGTWISNTMLEKLFVHKPELPAATVLSGQ